MSDGGALAIQTGSTPSRGETFAAALIAIPLLHIGLILGLAAVCAVYLITVLLLFGPELERMRATETDLVLSVTDFSPGHVVLASIQFMIGYLIGFGVTRPLSVIFRKANMTVIFAEVSLATLLIFVMAYVGIRDPLEAGGNFIAATMTADEAPVSMFLFWSLLFIIYVVPLYGGICFSAWRTAALHARRRPGRDNRDARSSS